MEHNKNSSPVLVILASLALVVILAVGAVFLREQIRNNAPTETTMMNSTVNSTDKPLPTLSAVLGGILAAEAESTTEEITTEETTTEVVTEFKMDEETYPHYIPSTDYSRIFYTDYHFREVGPEYFDDAVFIGNSRMQGFVLYSKLENLTAYTTIGMSVYSYFNKNAFNKDGVDMPASAALEHTPDFSKVYIMLGINEIGYTSPEPFIEGYSKILEHIYSCNPNAKIYVLSVLPVSKDAMEKDPSLDIEKIRAYNSALQMMCATYGTIYLDVASIFTGEDGFMPPEFAFDGVHLNANSVQILLDYLLKHAI